MPQVLRRLLGLAPVRRGRGRAPQHLGPPRRRFGRRREQLPGDPLQRRAVGVEHLGRAQPQLVLFGHGHGARDGFGDPGTGEPDPVRGQQTQAPQRSRRFLEVRPVEPAEPLERGGVTGLAERRQRPRQLRHPRRLGAQAAGDVVRRAGRPQRQHFGELPVGRAEVLGEHRVREGAEEHRAAAGDFAARGREALAGRFPAMVAEERPRPLRRQRPGLQDHGRRAHQVADHRAVRPGVAVEHGGHHDQRHRPQPVDEVGEPAQRLGVGPLQVVHDQRHGPVRGGFGDQHPQPVQQGVPAGRERRRVGRADQAQLRGQIPALGHQRLQQLPGHPVREAAFGGRGGRAQDPHPLRRREPGRGVQERRAAAAEPSADHRQRAGSPAAGRQQVGQHRQLGVALDQHGVPNSPSSNANNARSSARPVTPKCR